MNGTEIELFFPSKKKLKLQRRKLFPFIALRIRTSLFFHWFHLQFWGITCSNDVGGPRMQNMAWLNKMANSHFFCFLSFFNLFATSAKHVRPSITSLIRLSLTDTLFLNKRMQLYKGFPCNFFSRKYISMPLSITRVTYHSCTKPI